MRLVYLLSFSIGCTLSTGGHLGASSSSSQPTGLSAAGGGAEPDGPSWRKASDDYANGAGTDGDGNRWDTSFTHADVEKACGHRIRVAWDWPSFEGHSFDGFTPQAPGRMCVGEVLFRIAVMCGNEQRAKVQPITTVTCRYKACTELPPSAWDRNDGILDPGVEYARSSTVTNLDVLFCEKSSTTGTYDLYAWIKHPQYPAVKKPGSVQRKD